MTLSEKDILQILRWVDESSWDELHLESGTFKLTVSKNGRPVATATAPASAAAPAVPSPSAKPAPRAAPEEPVDPSWTAVRSPTLGNFYVAPQPGAPPFVTLGQKVGPDDTVAIVEVMKLMNHVKAETSGTIARICAANGDLVEFEQVLFWIDPAGHDA
jgi:acetyl-CoA carboxylase biotin carboxyl carrier protein